MNNTKTLGQVFTPEIIVNFMCKLVSHKKINNILEPSAGEGVFLNKLNLIFPESKITAYEIDDSLSNNSNVNISYCDFLSISDSKKYDLIIGNPPYVKWKNIPQSIKNDFENNAYWKDKINGQSDLLYAFIFKSIDLLEKNGELIFITPSFWIQTKHSRILRKYLLEQGHLELLINFNEMNIFKNVSSNIIIFKFVKNFDNKPIKVVNFKLKCKLSKEHIVCLENILNVLNLEDFIDDDSFEAFNYNKHLTELPFKLLPAPVDERLSKIEDSCINNSPLRTVYSSNNPLQIQLCRIFEKRDLDNLNKDNYDIKPVSYQNKIHYLVNKKPSLFDYSDLSYLRYTRLGDIVEIGNGMVSGLDKAFKTNNHIESDVTITVVKASDLTQYYNKDTTLYYYLNDITDESMFKTNYNEVYNTLLPFKDKLEKRYDYNRNIPWWHWVFLRNKKLMENSQEKIFIPCKERFDKRKYLRFAYVTGNKYATQDVTVLIKKDDVKEDLKYILGWLNSSMIYEWIIRKGLIRGGIAEFSERPLSDIPIRFINWENPVEVELHDNIVELVNQIIVNKNDSQNLKEEIERNVSQLVELY